MGTLSTPDVCPVQVLETWIFFCSPKRPPCDANQRTFGPSNDLAIINPQPWRHQGALTGAEGCSRVCKGQRTQLWLRLGVQTRGPM